MRMTSTRIVTALKNYAITHHITQNEMGRSLGFSKDRSKDIFSGRTKLNGDDVLRILEQYPLDELAKYARAPRRAKHTTD